MAFRKLVVIALCMIVVLPLFAQVDSLSSQEPTQDEHYFKEIPKDLPPARNLTPVNQDNIPPALLKKLRRNELYKGWEESPLYYDENTSLYLLYIKHGNTTITYGLSKKGKAVTYNAVTPLQ